MKTVNGEHERSIQYMNDIFSMTQGFKPDAKYWDHDVLTPEENSLRDFPAPWIRKIIEVIQHLQGKVVVEIGSTRRELTQACLNYYMHSDRMTSAEAPPCCQDGHSTHFWAAAGLETYTVDIDERCVEQLHNQYKHHIKTDVPNNLHIHIPQDGIEFLKNFHTNIDLLFLDGWDKGTHMYAERHLEAYLAAKDKFSPTHLIAIDDTDFITESGGKDKILTPYLIDNGYTLLLQGRQKLFINHV